MTKITLGPVRFDQQRLTYQARVDVLRDGRTFRYPCQVTAAANADPAAICHGLVQQALKMSDSASVH